MYVSTLLLEVISTRVSSLGGGDLQSHSYADDR
jgi:hypothetical protein